MYQTDYKFLKFFDKFGNNLNFQYDPGLKYWKGHINIPLVSVGLYENVSIFIVEKLLEKTLNSNKESIGYPVYDNSIWQYTDSPAIIARWESDKVEEIFLYNFDLNSNRPEIRILEEEEYELEVGYDSVTEEDFKIVNNLKSEALSINIALNSDTEGIYERTLILEEKYTGKIIAKIVFYGETLEEDERLPQNLYKLGMDLSPEEYKVFKESDINEILPDYQLINRKRVELLLEGRNIKPFVSTYKGLINAIKFYGYDNIKIREYWLNVDSESPQYGKYEATDVKDVFDRNADFNHKAFKLPTKTLKKTNLFSLVYRINRLTGEFDINEIPIVEETSEYTIDEVLIKLYGLKNILTKKWLSPTSKLIDIIGEGDYFNKIEQVIWNNQNRIDKIDLGIHPSFKYHTDSKGYIMDLRLFADLLDSTDIQHMFEPNLFLQDFGTNFTIEDLQYLGLNYFSDYYLRNYSKSPTQLIINEFTGLTPGEIADIVLEYFDTRLKEVEIFTQLPDMPNFFYEGRLHKIPVGYPIVLENTSFDDIWDNAKITWDAIRSFYRIPDDNDTNYDSDIYGSNFNTWDSYKLGNFWQIEWNLFKEEDETPAFRKQIIGPIKDFNKIAVVLPYTGTYTIEMRLYDTFNNFSHHIEKECLVVKSKNAEFLGFYKFREKNYNWNSVKITWNEYGSKWDLPITPQSVNWEGEASLYESLDRANYILNNSHPDHALSYHYGNNSSYHKEDFTPGAYFWDNLGSANWNDAYHLWWDSTKVSGDTPTTFRLDFNNFSINEYIEIEQEFPYYGYVKYFFNTDNINDIAFELNNSNNSVISKFIWNPVYDSSGELKFIQVVSKYFGKNGDVLEINTSSGLTVNYLIEHETNNPTWNEVKFIEDGQILPKLTYVTFTFDKSKIPGKNIDYWKIINNDSNDEDIYFTGRWLTYLFKDSGRYTIELSLKDANGNQSIMRKNMVIIK